MYKVRRVSEAMKNKIDRMIHSDGCHTLYGDQIYRTDTITQLYEYQFFERAASEEESITTVSLDVSSSLTKVVEFLKENGLVVVMNDSDSLIAYSEELIYVTANKANHTCKVSISHSDDHSSFVEKMRESLEFNPCFVEYVYDPQYLESITVPVDHGKLPIAEMYPFLNSSLNDHYNRFMESKSNILLLIGPPGTGKTSYIRGLLSHTQKSAILAYHEKIIEQDSFFVEWIRGNKTFMILEDSDNLLLPREEGNSLMSRFLNLGDGLMKFEGKKMIFTTNITDISKIDSALTRPGRCFDIVHFRDLTCDEANVVAEKCGVNKTDRRTISLSELFAGGTIKKKQSVGFV